MANKISAKKHTVHSFQVYFKPIALRFQLNQFFMNIYPSRLHLKPVQISRELKRKKYIEKKKEKKISQQVTPQEKETGFLIALCAP